MTQPHVEPSPVPGIIAAELKTALRDSTGGGVPGWARQSRDWPGKVVPANDRQAKAAVWTFLSRTRWPREQARSLAAAFAPLYQAGWCNDAIVRMLDSDPDGARQPPWFLGETSSPPGGTLHVYLNRRLASWSRTEADSVGMPDPPVAGTTFQAWAERMQLVYGDTERSRPARTASPPHGHPAPGRVIPTPLARRRNTVTRRQKALSGLTRHEDNGRFERDPDVTPDTALLLDPDVHEAIAVLARTGGRQHVARLRRAVLLARFSTTLSSGTLGDPETQAQIRQAAESIKLRDGTPAPLAMLALFLADIG
ncbi:hypothetical protein [Amycolatopsis sp. lyj-112]|uniref:hypothetical protein n=1 Tax=Amycolatopsis sp. lyj-112 TaxID=2789288 RepID=UPI00397DD3C2